MLKAAVQAIARRRRLVTALQVGALAVIFAFLVYAIRGDWREARPLLRHADLSDLALALALIAAYYLAFVVGWMWILRALAIRLSYRDALRAEMLSMLAKYVPGGVWTPAARVVAVRRAGVTNTPLVLGSIAYEAGLSAVAGVIVFFASLPTVASVDAPIWPLGAFAAALVVLLHPRIFQPGMRMIMRPLGGGEVPGLPVRTTLALLAYYSATWVVGGAALFFLVRSVADPPASSIPFLGGTSAVGAIVAVLVVFAPSGLGVREGSMYGLLLAVVPRSAALATVVLNRLAITLVEVMLLASAGLDRRRARARRRVDAEAANLASDSSAV